MLVIYTNFCVDPSVSYIGNFWRERYNFNKSTLMSSLLSLYGNVEEVFKKCFMIFQYPFFKYLISVRISDSVLLVAAAPQLCGVKFFNNC